MQKVLFIFFTLLSLNVIATEQEPDLLIVNNDTIYLQHFFLKKLQLNHNPFLEKNPLPIENTPSTSCWRGYRAIWTIENDSLFLTRIIRCRIGESRNDEEDIFKLFEKNDIPYIEKNGMIFASWATVKLYKYRSSSKCVRLSSIKESFFRKIYLNVENGIVLTLIDKVK